MSADVFPVLMAKSVAAGRLVPPSATLRGHLAQVTSVAQCVSETWGARALLTVGLPPSLWLDRLQRALPRSAFLHDMGKANDHFQRMIRHPGQVRQAFRHEWISLWLALAEPSLLTWLTQDCDDLTGFALLAAAGGHHLKLQTGTSLVARPSGALSLTVLGAHPDVTAALEDASTTLQLSSPPRLTDRTLSLSAARPLREVRAWLSDREEWWERDADESVRRFVALVKALVIGADVAGSAVPKMRIPDCRQWTQSVLANVCSADDANRVVSDRLQGAPLRTFQESVAHTPARVTFVRAGCGTGKTVAAYAWAACQADGRKVFFCYPTTGTTTEGFRDYVLDVDGLDAVLVHSRAGVDVADILENREGDDGPHAESLVQRDRLAGLESWRAQVTVSTVDAVLGLVQNGRRGLFSSPALVNGAFVFDEIHQYDDLLFDALEHFLRVFRGAPILLMTASLPPDRLDRLRRIMADLGESLGEVDGPPDMERLPRYVLRGALPAAAEAVARAALAGGQKVLWVSNRVRRCQAVARRMEGCSSAPVEPYHSRYRYVDRVAHHRAVLEGFDDAVVSPMLAATTQVCESSLDLSAALLVTDLAPVPALIQRLGRLNRRAVAGAPPCQALILDVPDDEALPYTPEDLDLARRWLAALGNGALSQKDLADTFESLAPPAPVRQTSESAWLAGGPLTPLGAIRESGTTVSVIRREDVGDGSADSVMRNAIPMPANPVMRELASWKRLGGALVVPDGRLAYDTRWGGAWA